MRDSDRLEGGWFGRCITCTKSGLVAWVDENDVLRFVKGWDNGHYVTRGNYVTRFEEENCNLQCSYRCNKMRSGEVVKYKAALKVKYGDDVPEKLEHMAELQPSATYHFTRDELLEIISDAKTEVVWYQSQH